jgi:V-type H+-transporting ATPase subunit a
MGTLWRSETMSLVQITMQKEAAHDTVEKLGELKCFQFRDLCSELNAYQRKYSGEIQQCEELERIMRYFYTLMQETKIEILPRNEHEKSQAIDIFSLHQTFEEYERDLIQLTQSVERLNDQINQCKETLYVTKACLLMFNEKDITEPQETTDEPDLQSTSSEVPMIEGNETIQTSNVPTGFVAGVISQNKIPSFVLLVNRASRGNAYPRFADIDGLMYDSITREMIPKSVFAVFFGAQGIRDRVRKICQSLGVSIYDFPTNVDETLIQIENKVQELQITLDTTTARRYNILHEIANHYESWYYQILKEKSIYNIMNMFDYKIRDSAIAEGWIAKKYINAAQDKLIEAQHSSRVRLDSFLEEIPTYEEPPTLFETNKFTSAFQDIVNAYGVPRYKELNPTVFTIITFPFLFAVMFGDWGHGIILTIFALSLVIFERKLITIAEKSELFGMIFHGRYIILLMGLFSIYTGLLYNDIFGLAIDFFGTSYPIFETNDKGVEEGIFSNETYIFGVDPAWYGTSNKLLFYNSLKMKMSVIFGIGHMSIGIVLAGFNMIYFNHVFDLFVEFIPEFLILLCTFGYMCLLIIIKWCRDWRYIDGGVPAILPTMTDFFLKFYYVNQPRVFGTSSGNEQLAIQIVLLTIAVIMIPILLIPKPIFDYSTHKKTRVNKHKTEMKHMAVEKITIQVTNSVLEEPITIEPTQVTLEVDEPPPLISQEDSEPFSERFIKQLIHTIEFVLGVVSNTASYLRLWALSLAHAQLSEVFWEMTMNLLLSSSNNSIMWFAGCGIGIFLMFSLWFALTITVLLMMESLSAFLHALRLHWVEFNNKFFAGDGYLFEPFDIERAIKEAQLTENEKL